MLYKAQKLSINLHYTPVYSCMCVIIKDVHDVLCPPKTTSTFRIKAAKKDTWTKKWYEII